MKVPLPLLACMIVAAGPAVAADDPAEICREATLVMNTLWKGHAEIIDRNVAVLQQADGPDKDLAEANANASAGHLAEAKPHMRRLIELCEGY